MEPLSIRRNAQDAWKLVTEEFPVAEDIKRNGYHRISATDLRRYREPRLMVKWDFSKSRPLILKENNYAILPETNSSYLVGKFSIYETLPIIEEAPEQIHLPALDTLNCEQLTSEANAIHALSNSGVLEDFLNTGRMHPTFNGRMRCPEFSFLVNGGCESKIRVHVDGVQCEIDAGFETNEEVIILEAKNKHCEDFNVRQLYYPYRIYTQKTKKPIRLVFATHEKGIFRLYEYTVKNPDDFNSIEFLQAKAYQLCATKTSFGSGAMS